ncbi:MAG: bifunctional metallophosphatase/5'-nucleotidase, partial [Desulfobacterales bacterium]|nr:bifunctional metallophosphatase/5'-nucleotidase [Desulfobacterales bacterium]
YVDVDDVLSMTTDTYIGVVEREFGKTVSYRDLTTFDLMTSFGLTQAEFDHFFQMVHTPEVLMGYSVVEGCVETLSAWADQGHFIDIVTGRPSWTHGATLDWLYRHRIPFNELTMVDKYNRPDVDPSVSISKAAFGRRSYDVAVEDSREMALYLAREMGVPVKLYHRPWNARPVADHRVCRVTCWGDIKGI